MSARAERLENANAVLLAISRHGRRFFEHKGRVSQFEMDIRNHVWLRDKWTGKRVHLTKRGRWRHFSDGGTLRALCQALLEYIRTGEPIGPSWFGPWPQWICDGDLWGYGHEAMTALRAELSKLPAVRPVAASLPSPIEREEGV